MDPQVFSRQVQLVQRLRQLSTPLVVVALRSPYDLAALPELETSIAIYGETEPSLTALSQLLSGAIVPQGRLPVEIPGQYPLGTGLTGFTKGARASCTKYERGLMPE